MAPLKNSDLQELRNLYFKCQTQIRSLESLGVKSETYSVMLCAIILKLFPSDLILEFTKQQISTTNHDLDESMSFLHIAIIARERTIHMQQSTVYLPSHRQASDSQSKHFSRKHYGDTSNRNKFISSANELMTNAASSSCIFCYQNHSSHLCRCEGVSESSSVNFVFSEKDAISSELRRFWELEGLGIRGDEIDTLGVNEQGNLREFNESTHHAVIREDKTSSRLRIVFDGTAHAEGEYSLNDCLHIGINLYPNLFELLVQFRKNAVTYTADVKQAYLQILINPEDRRFTKFFWIEYLSSDKRRVLNFTRALFGLKSNPYLLAATLKYHFEKYQHLFPETCEVLKNSFWVDDLVGGVDDLETILKISNESVEVMKRAGMVLRKWQTNSVPLSERYKQSGIETDDTKGNIRVLGLTWNPDKELIFFDAST
ncbi:hypothetical protein HNY73_012866 [Argiope bruennichi]|uniref:Reverse transcriptase domain-containing protein n=1 Tax=Argiope bruennichi TaxID=94029 RepID=A0A8T0F243_ARGBR|nr:hypothetical protein HNY73_012866 [Argiope bruennichi]